MAQNTELRFKDVEFAKYTDYDPENSKADDYGEVSYWKAATPDGQTIAQAYTKKECVKAAREYVRNLKEEYADVQTEESQPEQIAENSSEVAENQQKEETALAVIPEQDIFSMFAGTETHAEIVDQPVDVTVEEENDSCDIDAWLMGYIPKKKQPAILMLKKDDEGYWCRIGNGYIVETGKGEQVDIIHEAKWKEFLKSLRSVVKAA